MNEINSGFSPANSVSYDSSPKPPNVGVETSGHLQTAHGEKTVVPVKATQMTPKPQVENDLFGAPMQQRIVTVAETSSPEQTAEDLKTIHEAANDFKELRENPQKALAAIVARLIEQ
jgi:hypothetical protein